MGCLYRSLNVFSYNTITFHIESRRRTKGRKLRTLGTQEVSLFTKKHTTTLLPTDPRGSIPEDHTPTSVLSGTVLISQPWTLRLEDRGWRPRLPRFLIRLVVTDHYISQYGFITSEVFSGFPVSILLERLSTCVVNLQGPPGTWLLLYLRGVGKWCGTR